MKTKLRNALLALLFLSVSGACMSISLNPFKKEVVLMSPLKGTLLKGGKPLANADIEVKILMPDGEVRLFNHHSDSQGNFDLPVIKDSMVLGPMTEFAVSQWVFVMIDGERKRIWTAGKRQPELYGELRDDIDETDVGEIVGLTCDVFDKEYNPAVEKKYRILTTCKWESIRKL